MKKNLLKRKKIGNINLSKLILVRILVFCRLKIERKRIITEIIAEITNE